MLRLGRAGKQMSLSLSVCLLVNNIVLTMCMQGAAVDRPLRRCVCVTLLSGLLASFSLSLPASLTSLSLSLSLSRFLPFNNPFFSYLTPPSPPSLSSLPSILEKKAKTVQKI